jgi:HK97 family phage major capsid protein
VNEKEMRARLDAIDERLPQCRSELLALADGDLGDTEAARFDELETEHKTLTDEREQLAARLAKIDQVRETARAATAAAEQAGNDDGERNRSAGGRGIETDGGRSRAVRLDPFENLDAVRTNMVGQSDLRARALNAIEQVASDVFADGQRQRATELVERADRHGRIARHILMTGSDAYARAFSAILEGVPAYQLHGDEAEALRQAGEFQRASMAEGSDATGGFLVPFFLDPTVMLQNAGSTNPFRQISRVETITGPTWRGISTAGVSTQWLAEGTEIPSESNPTFAQPEIDLFKASAYLTASFEVTQDTNVVSQLGMLLSDAKDQMEATAHAVGTGSGQPQGVVTGVAAVAGSVIADSTSGSAAYVAADVYNLKAALPPRYRSNSSWVANEAILLKTRQFASGTGPQHAFWADFGMATPSQLLGRPVYESSAMDSTVADTKQILLVGDFQKGFIIVDRLGMTVQYEPLVMGPNRRPTGQVGWFAHWRTGAGVVNADAFRLLKIAAT